MQGDQKEKKYLLPNYDVEVKVTDPEADPIKGFYTYLVSGKDQLGTFQIRRRYNDFFYLRESLVKKWPGTYIPPIPEKKIAGNKDAQNIEIRKKLFDYFMKRLGKVKHLFTHHITQQFLRNKSLDLQKFYSALPSPRYSQIVQQYRNTYQKYINLDTKQLSDVKIKISGFGAFLKKAQSQLSNLRNQVEIIVNSRQNFTQKLNNCNAVMLPQYEKNVYVQYLPEEQKKDANLVFVNNHKVQDNIRTFRDVAAVNSFVATLDLLTYEILQVKAMQQAYKTKEKLQSTKKDKDEQLLTSQSQLAKLMGGKTTFKSLFSRGSKNEQISKLQKDIPELQNEIKSLNQLNEILTIIFGQIQLPSFKRQKQLQYYKMMYQVSENELKYLSSYGQLMKSVMQGVNKEE